VHGHPVSTSNFLIGGGNSNDCLQKHIFPRALPSFILTIVFGIVSLANANYTNIHDFAGGAGDGKNPYGSISIFGNTLYGMTYRGGTNTEGVIFKVEIDGSNYTNLHEFAGGNDDGQFPYYTSLLENDGCFYGMTFSGGISNNGVVFRQIVPEPDLYPAIVAVLYFIYYLKIKNLK